MNKVALKKAVNFLRDSVTDEQFNMRWYQGFWYDLLGFQKYGNLIFEVTLEEYEYLFRQTSYPDGYDTTRQDVIDRLLHFIRANEMNQDKTLIQLINKRYNQIGSQVTVDTDLALQEFPKFSSRAEQISPPCAILWFQPSDGQMGYWSPQGAVKEPYWYD